MNDTQLLIITVVVTSILYALLIYVAYRWFSPKWKEAVAIMISAYGMFAIFDGMPSSFEYIADYSGAAGTIIGSLLFFGVPAYCLYKKARQDITISKNEHTKSSILAKSKNDGAEVLNWLYVTLVVALSILSITVGYWLSERNSSVTTEQNYGIDYNQTQETNESLTNQYISALSQLTVLPQGEPVVARIDDPKVLWKENYNFYRDVQVGDILFVFPTKAYIYRPSSNKIINSSPIIQ